MGNTQGLEEAFTALAVRRLREQQRREIERAVDAAKGIRRTALDEWYRRQWYRAIAIRKRAEAQRATKRNHGGDAAWDSTMS